MLRYDKFVDIDERQIRVFVHISIKTVVEGCEYTFGSDLDFRFDIQFPRQ